VLSLFAVSLGLAEDREPVRAADLVERFDPALVPLAPWTMPASVTAAQ